MADMDEVDDILDILRIDPDTGVGTIIGAMGVTPDGRLQVLSVNAEHAATLAGAVTALNGKLSIAELTPAANAAGPGDLAARITRRGDPGFVGAMARYLARYYGFSLG